MIKRLFLAFTLLTAATLPAQEITLETPATSAQRIQWLHSGDPRLIAWSATLAIQHHDIATITQMPALLQTWHLIGSSDTPSKARSEQYRAIAAILDALIQEHTPVTLLAIKAVSGDFPAQAAILINRLPLHESQPALRNWAHAATGAYFGILPRIAAMLLAQDPHPDPEFVAEIVAYAEETLEVSITSGNTGEAFGRGSCGDTVGHPLPDGWPQVYTYDLVENEAHANATLLLELDGDKIAYRRFKENEGYGSCSGVEPLDSTTRHRLIAHWLGVTPRNMPWHPTESVTIIWSNKADYQQQLGAAIDSHRARLKATYDTLTQRGLLIQTPSGDQGLPKLTITIRCEIKPCPTDLK